MGSSVSSVCHAKESGCCPLDSENRTVRFMIQKVSFGSRLSRLKQAATSSVTMDESPADRGHFVLWRGSVHASERQRQEDQEFKATLSYRENSEATCNLVSKSNIKKVSKMGQ